MERKVFNGTLVPLSNKYNHSYYVNLCYPAQQKAGMQKFLVPFRFEYDCTKLNALAEKTCRFYLPCTEKLYIQVTSTYSLLLRTAYGTDYLLHPFLNIFRELQQLLTTYYKYIQFRLAEGAGYFTHYNIRNIQEFSKDASDLRFLTSEFINRIDELTSDLEQLCNIIECLAVYWIQYKL